MNACIALDATARNLFQVDQAGAKNYKKCVRQYYWIIEPMIGSGLNLEETIWENLKISDGNGNPIVTPDFADIIYHIFRCNHAHGREVPANYKLLPSKDGCSHWTISNDMIYMPDRVLWALLAVSIFCEANAEIRTESGHYLTWGSEQLGIGTYTFPISESWGQEGKFREFLSKHEIIRVKLDKLSFLSTE